jgi:hypothetical protein
LKFFVESDSGLPRPVFGKQDRHKGSHITGAMPSVPLPRFILQNPGKTTVMVVLPPVVAPHRYFKYVTVCQERLHCRKILPVKVGRLTYKFERWQIFKASSILRFKNPNFPFPNFPFPISYSNVSGSVD